MITVIQHLKNATQARRNRATKSKPNETNKKRESALWDGALRALSHAEPPKEDNQHTNQNQKGRVSSKSPQPEPFKVKKTRGGLGDVGPSDRTSP